jgi:hypothetical protein
MSDFFSTAVSVVDKDVGRYGTDFGEFWRKDEPILGPEGQLIRGGMFEHQRRCWELPNFITGIVGGYGSGKSLNLVKRAIASSFENAPCPVAIVSPTFPIARRTIIPLMNQLLVGKQTLYGKGFWFRYNKTFHEYRLRFRGREATILVLSGEDPIALRGPNLAAAYIDEPFIQDEEVFHQLVARVRHPEATKREIMFAGTPEQLNWGYDLCVGDMSTKHDIAIVTASTRQNKALDSGYVHRLEGSFSAKAAMAFIEGQFINLADGMVYYAFSRENIVSIPTPEEAELGVGMDFNVNPMCGAIFWRTGSHMHFFDEVELENADTEYMCSYLNSKYGGRLRYAYPDATGSTRKTSAPGGKSDHHFLRDAGFIIKARATNPKRRDRYNAVNGKLKSKAGFITLTIEPTCKKIIKYLTTYSYDLMNKQDEEMSHLLDAFSYPVAYLFPVDRDTVSSHRFKGF